MPPLAIGNVPVTPVVSGRPVILVAVPEEGVPSTGVTKVGLVAKTNAPDPVSLVTADARLADVGVPKKVATLLPSPDTPVEIGSPVALVNVPDAGVPKAGVTNVGLVAKTNDPDPVSSVTAVARLAEDGVPNHAATPEPKLVIPVPPLATGSVPVTPVDKGSPVRLVATPEAGVPRRGVIKVVLVIALTTLAPEPAPSV